MKKKGIEVGNIKPIYNLVGFQICKKVGESDSDSEWTQVEKQVEAEILSFIYRREKPIKKTKAKVEETEEEDDDDIDLSEEEL